MNFLVWLIPLCLLFGGATAQTYTKQTARVIRVQADTTYADAASVNAARVPMTAFFQADLIYDPANPSNNAGANQWKSVSYDLLAPPVSTTNYTAAGKTVNGVQLAALIREVAISELNRQGGQ